MNVLITAGNTQAPIDRVRCITNIFSGRTGASIAMEAHARGHNVTLATSHPEAAEALNRKRPEGWRVLTYRTFDELEALMARVVLGQALDAVVHCAAVNDYRSDGIFAPVEGTQFDANQGCWRSALGSEPQLESRAAGKVKSSEPELWLRLVRSPKLIDRIRRDWSFTGLLVKFKLEVDVGDDALTKTAEVSRLQSQADLMVANSLEGMTSWAFIGPVGGRYEKIPRRELAVRLIVELEGLDEASRSAPQTPRRG